MGIIADGNVIEADDVLSSMRTTVEAGEAITIGKACYIKESDGKAYLSDSSSAPYFTGIAFAGVDSGADVTLVTKGKFVTTSLTDKEIYFLGSSGAISTVDSGIRVGTANGTTDLYIDTNQYNEGGALSALIHRVSYNDDTERTTSSTSFVDSGTTFTLAAPAGSVILGGWVQCQMAGGSATQSMNLQFTGSNLGTWWCQQGASNYNAVSSYFDWDPFWADTGTFNEYQLCGMRVISYDKWNACNIPAGLKILDDDTVVKVRIKTSDGGIAMTIKNITITLVYTTGATEDS